MTQTTASSPGPSAGPGAHSHEVPGGKLLGVPRRALFLALLFGTIAAVMFTVLLLQVRGLVDEVLANSEQTARLAKQVQQQSDDIEEQSARNGDLVEDGVECVLVELGEHRVASNNFQTAVDDLLVDQPGFEFDRDPFRPFDPTNGGTEDPEAPCDRFVQRVDEP